MPFSFTFFMLRSKYVKEEMILCSTDSVPSAGRKSRAMGRTAQTAEPESLKVRTGVQTRGAGRLTSRSQIAANSAATAAASFLPGRKSRLQKNSQKQRKAGGETFGSILPAVFQHFRHSTGFASSGSCSGSILTSFIAA